MSRDRFLTASVAIILLSNVLFDALLWILRKMTPTLVTDFQGQRALCAYTLRGIDPYPQIGIEPPLLPDVGSIPMFFGTSPWGLTLNNLFYPAFLPFELAQNYFWELNAVVLLMTALVLYEASKETDARLGRIALALFALPAPFVLAVWYGNAGGMICCLLLICCAICDRRPVLTGILLGVAMIKPQTALPFCILFLFQRRFKILLTAAAIDIGAWLMASALTGTNPITLMIEMLDANIGGGMMFSGLLSLFVDEPMRSIYLSMTVGVIFIVVLHYRSTEQNFLSMYPACVAAIFWSYSTGNEIFILILPALNCFRIMLEDNVERLQWFWAGIFFYSVLMFLQVLAMSCNAFALNPSLITVCVTLRVCFCFVFIAIALCINQHHFDRIAH